MTTEGDLYVYEDKSSTHNIKPKLYSQTQKARMRCRLKIQQESIGKRETTYQLQLLYHAFRDIPVLPINYDRNILEDDENLEDFLSKEFGLSSSDFREESVGHNRDLYRVRHMVRKVPGDDIRYSKIEYLKGSGSLEGRHHYRYQLPGVSIREFLRGIHGGQALEHAPQFLSQSEAEEYFGLLVREGLIKQVITFHGEARYDITDENLRTFLKDCWVVHGIASLTMRLIWERIRSPTSEEREWYEMLWGKQRTTVHLNHDFEMLKTRKIDPAKKGYRKASNEEKSMIIDWGYRGIAENFERMKEKHKTTIKKHPVVSHMLIKMVYPQFLQTLIVKKTI